MVKCRHQGWVPCGDESGMRVSERRWPPRFFCAYAYIGNFVSLSLDRSLCSLNLLGQGLLQLCPCGCSASTSLLGEILLRPPSDISSLPSGLPVRGCFAITLLLFLAQASTWCTALCPHSMQLLPLLVAFSAVTPRGMSRVSASASFLTWPHGRRKEGEITEQHLLNRIDFLKLKTFICCRSEKRGAGHHNLTDGYTWWTIWLSQLSPEEQNYGAQKTKIQSWYICGKAAVLKYLKLELVVD